MVSEGRQSTGKRETPWVKNNSHQVSPSCSVRVRFVVIHALWYCDEVLKASPSVHLQTALLLWGMSGTGEKEKEKAKGKRKVKQEEDEDYRELPQKKHKLYGRVLRCLSFPGRLGFTL